MSKRKKELNEAFLELTKEIDLEALRKSIKENFGDFPDPRIERNRIYPIWYLFFITLSAYLAGANTIQDIVYFAEFRLDWINSITGESFPVPSYNTFWWLFARTDPDFFKSLLKRWFTGLSQDLQEKIFAIDGKRLRRASKCGNLVHLVELFSLDNKLMIAFEKVPDKDCERDVLESLLDAIDVRGALVTMDAHYTYTPPS